MDEWKPILVLPNLDMQAAIECEFAAIVSPADSCVEQICKDHQKFTTFLGKFSGQFKEQCWPSLLILRADAPDTCRTAEAVTAFRDLASLCAVPIARAKRLRFDRGERLIPLAPGPQDMVSGATLGAQRLAYKILISPEAKA